MAKTLGYTLSRITDDPTGGFITAALLQDMITGEVISSMGGGSLALSKATVKVLQEDQEVRELIKRKLASIKEQSSS